MLGECIVTPHKRNETRKLQRKLAAFLTPRRMYQHATGYHRHLEKETNMEQSPFRRTPRARCSHVSRVVAHYRTRYWDLFERRFDEWSDTAASRQLTA